nr:hypothetical protein [Leptospira borgpetersenii]
MPSLFVAIGSDLERVPKPFDFIGILADRCNCSYVLGRALIWRPIRSSKSFFAYFLNHPII